MSITTILFDAGGTLVFPNFSRIADALAPHAPGANAQALARADARVRFDLDRPEVIAVTDDQARFRRYFDALVGAVGLPAIPDQVFARLHRYHNVHNLWEHVPPDVPPALDRLRARFRLGVVSNANGTVRAKLARVGLSRFFEVVVDSHEEGVEKPDPRLFRIALERIGSTPAETAYVGDLYHVDVVGAAAAGLRPYLLDPHDLHAGKDVARLRTLAELMAA